MVGRLAPLLALALLASACAGVTWRASTATPDASGTAAVVATAAPSAAASRVTPAPTARVLPEPCRLDAACGPIASAIDRIDAAKMNDHLMALTAVGSRDP